MTVGCAPDELLAPIKDFHVGLQERNWTKMAAAYPYLDRTNDEHAEKLSEQYLSFNFGRWAYIRRIDSWWCEGNRACVVVRGIEHTMPFDEDPATNEETVITYGLRKYEGRWIISTWSQGWPKHGSAPKLRSKQAWRDEWNLE